MPIFAGNLIKMCQYIILFVTAILFLNNLWLNCLFRMYTFILNTFSP